MSNWKIKSAQEPNADRVILPPGRYKAKLTTIKEREYPDFDTREMTPKLIFVFVPYDVNVPSGKSVTITTIVPPKMSPSSNLYKLLAKMDPSGFVPDEATKSADTYQAYAESFIGKNFILTSRPNKAHTYNIIHANDISPVPEEIPQMKETRQATITQAPPVPDPDPDMPEWLKTDPDDPGATPEANDEDDLPF